MGYTAKVSPINTAATRIQIPQYDGFVDFDANANVTLQGKRINDTILVDFKAAFAAYQADNNSAFAQQHLPSTTYPSKPAARTPAYRSADDAWAAEDTEAYIDLHNAGY